jgi:hypothetical protein
MFLVLVSSPLQASAAAKAGATCTKAGAISTVNGIKYTCVKSGKKLVWNKGVKVVAAPTPSPTPTVTPTATPTPSPTPTVTQSPTPTVTPTPTATPTPTKTFNSLWEKYDLTKPTTVDEVIKKSTDNFKSYTSVVRNSEQEIKFYSQTGVDETLTTWVKEGATYVARRFAYPKLPPTFSSIIAIDKTWLEATYLAAGFPANKAKGQAEGFCGGAPACGSADSNLWNYSVIVKNNSMVINFFYRNLLM